MTTATMTFDIPQALDLLINFHGQDAHSQMNSPAPKEAIPAGLATSDSTCTVRDVVLHHLLNNTTPGASLNDALSTVSKSSNSGVSGQLKSCTVSNDAQKVEDWIFVTIDSVSVIIDMFFLVEAGAELDREAIAEKHMNNAGSLLEKELKTIMKGGDLWEQAKAFFKVLKKAFEFGMFQDIFHALAADWSVWDYIKESVLALVQIIAWLATDFIAAVAEFVEKLTTTVEDIDKLYEDIENLCSFNDVESAIGSLESPIQLHTPAATQYGGDYYVAQCLKGYHAVLVYKTTGEQLNSYQAAAEKLNTELANKQITQSQAAEAFKAISPWQTTHTLSFVDKTQTLHDPVGAPALMVFQDTLFCAILTGDQSSIIEGNPPKFRGEIYLTFSTDGTSWAPAYKLGTVDDAGCAAAFCEVNDTLFCVYMQGVSGQIFNCSTTDGTGWGVQEAVMNGTATTATTPGVCINTDNDNNSGLTILYRGSGSNTDIWQVQSNPDFSWQGPDAQCSGTFETLSSPMPVVLADNWRYVYYRGSDPFIAHLYCGDRFPGPREPYVYPFIDILVSGSPSPCGDYIFYADEHYSLQFAGINSYS
ncbi:hypothetical protein [Kordiimonas sp.]|uniref:hypothetical protein n=1 Tax=Kordiimonas sp. TaxID=1970157 RepID=UPI003A8D8A7E